MMPTPSLQISYSLSNINHAADQFWQYAHQFPVMAFSAEMGAGKTSFIHALCDHLGVKDAVSSPTFALINEYHYEDATGLDRTIFHMDWYRLKDTEEAMNAGMEDTLEQKEAYCFIEWPEKAMELITPPYLWVAIEITGPEERVMRVFEHSRSQS
jgi:tRNA threonylcarbamoyladenosine biosynthesis protein TsaE